MNMIDVDKVKVGKYRVRLSMDKEKLDSLIANIKQRNVIAPIIVRPIKGKGGNYELIAGERRLKATKANGLKWIPAIIQDVNDREAVLLMGIENIQREELGYEERGRWVKKMMDMGYSQTELARETGIPNMRLSSWRSFYEEGERMAHIAAINEPVELPPLDSTLAIKRSELPQETKDKLMVEAGKLQTPRYAINRAIGLMEEEPDLTPKEALERAEAFTLILTVPPMVMEKLKEVAETSNSTMQDVAVNVLKEWAERQ